MIAPFQVWQVDLTDTPAATVSSLVVVVSSPFHLRLTNGALLTVVPLTTRERKWPHRVPITSIPPRPLWALTELVRTIAGTRITHPTPIGRLTGEEITALTRSLSTMVALS